jgi:hypothetical protein
MNYTVITTSGPLLLEADEYRLEGGHHVFRRTQLLMGNPRIVVVRRLPEAEVLEVTRAE